MPGTIRNLFWTAILPMTEGTYTALPLLPDLHNDKFLVVQRETFSRSKASHADSIAAIPGAL
jgi:hypothetical protein